MAMVSFKKGLLSTLPSTYAEGTFYVTTDERAIYLDVSDSARIRLGDFQEFDSIEALRANTNPSTTALYYISGVNVLAKWNGTDYVQINTDTGATSVEVVGEGNAVTAASYDATTRKLTLTMGETFATADDLDAVNTRVGAIPEGYTEETVIAYINKKAEETLNAATGDGGESAASVKAALETYKTTNDASVKANADAIKALQDANAEGGAVDTAIKGAQDAADKAQTEIDALEDVVGEVAEGETVVGMIEDAAKAASDAQATADAKVASVAAGDGSVTVGGTTTAPTVAVKLSAEAGNALALLEDGLMVEIPAAAEYSIVKAENSGDYAAVYNLTKDGTVVGASINIPKDMVVQSGSVVENPEGQAEGTYIKLVLQNVEEPLYINVGNLIEYVTSGSQAGDMVLIDISDDHKVTATIADASITVNKLASDVQTAIGKAHTHENADVLAGINADKVAAWDAAEQNAKDYTDALAEGAVATNTAAIAKLNGDENTEGSVAAQIADAIALEAQAREEADNALDGRVDTLEGEMDTAQSDIETLQTTVAKLDGTAEVEGSVAKALADAKDYADQAEEDAVTAANTYTNEVLQWGSF